MKRIKEYLEIRKRKHEKENDTVIVIAGLEGISKSTLAKHFLHIWKEVWGEEVTEKDIKFIGMSPKKFVHAINDSKLNGIPIFDEGGDLNNRATLTKFNRALMEAYTIIRGEQLMTVICIADFFILDPFFRKHRVKALFLVYERGRVACWLRNKVMLICDINQSREIKTPWRVKPDFYDTFPIYNGILEKQYKEMKKEKIKHTKQSLLKIFEVEVKQQVEDETKKQETKIMMQMRDQGLTHKQIAEHLQVSRQTVTHRLAKAKYNKNI